MKKFLTILAATAALAAFAPSADAAKIAVVGGSNDDAFWNLIKKGLDDARPGVEANGGSVNYLRLVNYDNFAPDVVGLIRTAISQKVDGLVIPDWVPESEDPAIKDAMKAGIKVILMNAGGGEKAKELGALNYVGSDEYTAGVAGGTYFGSHGAKHVLCVNTIPGAANLEARCKGVVDGITKTGGKAEQLPLPSTSFGNATAIAEAIKAEIIKDGTIDGIINIGAADADAGALGIQQSGKKIMHGTFDLNKSVLERIKGGTQAFAIDQQPYLQGLLAVNLLAGYIDFGTVLPTFPVLTGPGVVDASNIDATLNGVAKGAR
ncbi:MAG: substrate-binding domain-containing protein [Alphaproteobacteria bacterium]|nr:substrate-binding domain-containing protein [Alphaproteobacteria bacterium]